MSEEIKQACHELTKAWEAIGGGASGQYHGNDYQQGLRTAYNQCAYELKEMLAGVRKPVTTQTPNESTLASATGWASEVNAMAKRLLEIEEAVARQNVGTHIWTNIHIGRLHIQDAGRSLGKMPNVPADLPRTGDAEQPKALPIKAQLE